MARKRIFDDETDIEITKNLDGEVISISVNDETYEVEQDETSYNEDDDTLTTTLNFIGTSEADDEEDEDDEEFSEEIEEYYEDDEDFEDEDDEAVSDSRKSLGRRKAKDSARQKLVKSLGLLRKVVKDSAKKLRKSKAVTIKVNDSIAKLIRDKKDRAVLGRQVSRWAMSTKAISDSRKKASVAWGNGNKMLRITLK